ncbi:MAG: azurin [Rhodanobacter sp.]|nr:MAG: azurin [Rhodanobacter sp.]TAM12016.1 MAG: azurin [Rhodanobacter sp.]TAM34643.1 MAG: azurin [Rhodanobacter sp.]
MRKLIVLALLGLASSPLMAADCATTVEANDAMQFNVHSITVPKACKTFKVTLKHTGKLPVASMGHDWVLTTAADEKAVLAADAAAGAAKGYEKANDPKVIASTKLIGGGESATTTVNVSKLKAGQDYVYFCSFPGHATLMHGTLTVK